MSRISPALVPVTLLLWLSLAASHWRRSLGQQLEQHLGQQLGELSRFRDMPDDSPRRRLERFQSDETPILQSLPTAAIRAVKSAGSSADRRRGGATKVEGASAAAAGFPSSAFPRVFESGQGSCGFPDTRADADECVADLAEFPALSARSGSATVRKLACLAHNYLRPWMGIPGVTAGMGARGMISAEILHQMGTMANVPWEQKQGRAVFRGGMTNYHIAMPMHWRASPRFRVHRMADARPDLLDARVMSGVDVRWRESLEADGVRLGGRLKPEELQGFKYELDVDGGTGSGRTCGILASNQVLIRQASEYYQFFDPLLCPMKHFLPTHRYFNNLYSQIQWARANDQRAREIVAAANDFASLLAPPFPSPTHPLRPVTNFARFIAVSPRTIPPQFLSFLPTLVSSLIPPLSFLLSHPSSLVPALSSRSYPAAPCARGRGASYSGLFCSSSTPKCLRAQRQHHSSASPDAPGSFPPLSNHFLMSFPPCFLSYPSPPCSTLCITAPPIPLRVLLPLSHNFLLYSSLRLGLLLSSPLMQHSLHMGGTASLLGYPAR
ncbi:unnamed protein product [Closterium sp. NIES-65]|nr:unnamed protein product [Closterium sp. NIES-65]